MSFILPKGRTQFADSNGAPLAGGSVAFYVPGTLTPKDTWQDAGNVTLNANPVTLDSAGSATIYGAGQYRQIVKDAAGNTLFDGLTEEAASALKVQAGAYLSATAVSGTNAVALTFAPAIAALSDGQLVRWKVAGANTGAVTINPSGLGATALLKPGSGGPAALAGAELQAGNVVEAAYDLANNRFLLVSPGPASKTLMQGAADTASIVTPSQVQNHPGVAKVRARVSSAGAILDGYGLTSVTKLGTGDYQVNFTTSFANVNYTVIATLDDAAGWAVIPAVNRAINSCRVQPRDPTNTALDAGFNLAIFGQQ